VLAHTGEEGFFLLSSESFDLDERAARVPAHRGRTRARENRAAGLLRALSALGRTHGRRVTVGHFWR
jgi:hypothetical protein